MERIANFTIGWWFTPAARHVFRREIRNYFNTPIGYVFAVTCLLLNFLLFFTGMPGITPDFWSARAASIRSYMVMLPLTFILLVPAISMRLWAEERRSGTIELLSTLPMTDFEIVIGKFMAAWAMVSGIILASLPLTFSIALIGPLAWGETFTLYLGSILMAGAYVSMGMLISALTREQIVAFILILLASAVMFLGHYFIITRGLPESVARFVGFFSHSYHFQSFSRGILDLGDLIYFTAFMGLMLAANIWVLRRAR